MRSIEKIIAAAALLAAVSLSAETINPNDYAKSVKIRFDGYTGTSALTNFPALIELRDNINGFRYSDMESDDYSDLRFTKDDGTTTIPFEVEEWNVAAPAAVDPSSISGCLLWLKADDGALTNAAGGVTNWLDRSGNANNAISQAAADHPALVPGALNGEPVVRFSGANDNYIKFSKLTNIRTVFWVIREDADATYTPNPRFLLGDQGGSSYHFHRGSNKEIWSNAHAPLMFQGVTELNGREIDGRITLMPTDMNVISVRTSGNATANTLAYDRNINGRTWDGDVAEVILYNRQLTTEEMHGVYAYLEGKYAIEMEIDRKSAIWVQIPELTNNAAVFAYWSNPAATELPVYATNGSVWSEDYVGVYHLSEKGFVTSLADSSPLNNDMAAVSAPAEAGGISGLCRSFAYSNADQPLRISSPAGGLTLDEVTVATWVNVVNGISWKDWWGIEAGSGNHLRMELDSDTPGRCNIYNTNVTGANPIGDPSTPVEDGRWHHLVFTGSTSANQAKVYVDGVQDGATVAWSAVGTATGLKIGASWGTYTASVGGRIDEARFSAVARSADWIKASHDNQSNPSVFSTTELNFYYDTSTGAGLQSGNGAWNTTTNLWSTGPGGSTSLSSWEQGARAFFDADGTSVIEVDAILAQTLVFNGTGYQLTGGSIGLDRFGIEANESASVGSAITLLNDQSWTAAAGRTLNVGGATDNSGYTLTMAGDGDTTISGIISGAGALLQEGSGSTLLDAYNAYTGSTTIDNGTLRLNKGGQTGCVRGTMNVGPGGQLDLLANNSLGYGNNRVTTLNINGGLVNNTAAGDNGWGITINMTGGELRSNGGISSAAATSYYSLGGGSAVNTLPSADTALISGRIALREGNTDNLLGFNVADGDADIDLLVSAVLTPQSGGGIIKSGPGTMNLTGSGTYTGTTRIDNGTLLVNAPSGSATGTSAVQLNGGVLGGTGTVASAVSISANGGFIAPGNSIGTLNIAGGIDMSSSGTAGIYIEIDDSANYDSINVSGTVSLGDCHLSGILTGTVTAGDKFFIIVNDATDSVSGNFNGIPEGGTVAIDGYEFTVGYQGDSETDSTSGGNDVVLYNGSPLTPPAPSAPYWKQITFGGYTLPSILTDFPVLVVFEENMEDFTYTTFLSPTGGDLRFYSDTNKTVELSYEIEQWNTDGTSYVWVLLPQLKKGTSIWAYWGDLSQTTPPAYTTDGSTWNSGFAGVWHLSDAGGASTDSTSASLDGVNNGTSSTAGLIGNARNFAGSESISLSAASLASITNQVTVSFWQWGGVNNQCTIFSANNASNQRVIQSHLPWSGSIYWDAGNSSYDRINRGASLSEYTGEWSLWSFTKNVTDGTMRIYRNGVLWHSGGGLYRIISGATTFRIGSNATGVESYKGDIDEFRVSNVERSADWIRACYLNQSDPVSFAAPRAAAYWDTSSAVGVQSGSGTWDSGSTASWSEDGIFGSSPLQTWSAGTDAYFTAGGGGTVSAANGTSVGAITVDAAGYTVAGGALTLKGGIAASESLSLSASVNLGEFQTWEISSGRTLTASGLISGPSGIIKRGAGTLNLRAFNNFSGGITVDEGHLLVDVSQWGGNPGQGTGRLVINDGALGDFRGAHAFGSDTGGRDVFINGGVLYFQNENYVRTVEIKAGLIYGGGENRAATGGQLITYAAERPSIISNNFNMVYSKTFNVQDGEADDDLIIAGNMFSTGNITKTGAGTMKTTGANTYAGTTAVNAGTLRIDGSHSGSGAYTINGGTLAGKGSISAPVAFGSNGGSIAPGTQTGKLTVNNSVDFTSTGTRSLDVTINGTAEGEYGVLAVNGTVNLAAAALNVTVNTALIGTQKFVIIENDGDDAVTGTFTALPDGSFFKSGDETFSIHYSADADSGETSGGNDVMIVSIPGGTLIILK